MIEDLNPCPFCGGDADIERAGNNRVSTIYQCIDCGCTLETGEEFNHGKQWNARAPQNEWISVDYFKSAHCYVYACCNDIVNCWTEILYVNELGEFFFPHGTRYPAPITHVMAITLPTPPKEI